MKNKRTCLILCCLILAMFIPFTHVSAAPKGKVIYVTNSPNFYMTGLDWFTARGYVSNSIKTIFSDSLIIKNIDGSFSPGLAKSWQITNGGLSVKFTMVKNAKFSDGTPVTAEDVKYSLERYTKPELKYVFGKAWQKVLKDIVVEDDYHLTVNLNALYPDFIDRNGEYFGIAPKKYIEQVGDKGFADKPIGCGPQGHDCSDADGNAHHRQQCPRPAAGEVPPGMVHPAITYVNRRRRYPRRPSFPSAVRGPTRRG